ncbi:MAG: metallophosphoesterase family protein [Flavobacteriales bacterium]
MKTKFTSISICVVLLLLSVFYACKKEKVEAENNNNSNANINNNDTTAIVHFDSTYAGETTNAALKILVISDLNSSYGSTAYEAEVGAVMNKVAEINPDIVLCGGDMVAGQSNSLTDDQIKAMWSSFDTKVRKKVVDLGIPFGFTVGNHDASPSYARDRQLAQEYWTAPGHQTLVNMVDSTHYPFYYSYIENNVFIISWDAAGQTVPAEMKTWLQNQLASTVAKNSRMQILLGHLPLYPVVSSKNKSGEVLADADNLRDFLLAEGIDLYISGHQHAYYPAHKNGLELLNLGALGSGPRVLMNSTQVSPIKTYTVIDVPVLNASAFTYNTYKPSSAFQLFDESTLPTTITGFNGFVTRRDIAE